MGEMTVGEQFKITLKSHFDSLTHAGLDPNSAAAYSLKWAVGSASPAGIAPPDLSSAQAVRVNERHVPASSPEAKLTDAEQRQMHQLLSSGDSIFLTALLRFRAAAAEMSAGDAGDADSMSKGEQAQGLDTAAAPSQDHDAAQAQADQTPAPSDSAPGAEPAAARPPLTAFRDADPLDAAFAFFSRTFRSSEPSMAAPAVAEQVQALVAQGGPLEDTLSWCPAEAQAVILACLLVLPHASEVAQQQSIVERLVTLFHSHRDTAGAALTALFARCAAAPRGAAVFAVQQFITLRLYSSRSLDTATATAAALLERLHAANEAAREEQRLPLDAFYNDVVNSPDFDLQVDWDRFSRAVHSGDGTIFSFCRYPFMYAAPAKAQFLRFDAAASMHQGFVSAMFGGGGGPYLVLTVRRGPELVRDALTRIRAAMRSGSLKKPLKVQFSGEQGVDEGGVSREFFQLIVQECSSPNYGMFISVPESNVFWFRASALADLSDEFELIGAVVGLAIYNAHVLDFAFAPAVYAKLLGAPLTLAALRDVEPGTFRSLTQLLAYPAERVEDDMALTFQVTHEVDFCSETHDLVPDGGNVAVTGATRDAFVDAYVRFLLVERIAAQYEAFERGFRRVCDSHVLAMFAPAELQQVACGAQDIDFTELRRSAAYDGGYKSDSPVIEWLWEVLLAVDEAEKRKFLQFVTGSERAPVGGLAALQPPFLVAKNGGHSARLPTAHTCFNSLLLPEYESKDALRERLLLALQNATGFGLM